MPHLESPDGLVYKAEAIVHRDTHAELVVPSKLPLPAPTLARKRSPNS